MTYTLTRQHLQSPFAGIDLQTMKKIRARLVADIKSAVSYRIEAANGSTLSAPLRHTIDSQGPDLADFTVELFPVMIFRQSFVPRLAAARFAYWVRFINALGIQPGDETIGRYGDDDC